MNPFKLDQYKINPQENLGSGPTGQVYQGISLKTGQKVAIKIIKKSIDNQQVLSRLRVQFTQLLSLDHQNIVQIKQVKQNSKFFYIIYQLCQISLQRKIKICLNQGVNSFTETESCQIIKQIFAGLKYLHSIKFIHRNINPSNILLKGNVVKISGFTLIKIKLQNDPVNTNQTVLTQYMSYQQLFSLPYTQKCDVWSVGCILYKLLHLQLPWQSFSLFQIKKYLSNIKHLIKIQRKDLSPQTEKLLKSCLAVHQNQRLSLVEIYKQNYLFFNKKTPSLVYSQNNINNNKQEDINYKEKINYQKYVSSRDIKRFTGKQNQLLVLHHLQKEVKIKDFLQYNWSLFYKIDFGYCSIDDESWLLFVKNAKNFPRLQILYLGTFIINLISLDGNFIKNVNEEQLNSFKNLRQIFFVYKHGQNLLTKQSQRRLQKFEQQNPKKTIVYKWNNFNQNCECIKCQKKLKQ